MRSGVSDLYTGIVEHHRLRPRRHSLNYRIFMLLLDLDQLPSMFRRLRLLRSGRFGLMSFNAADYGDRSGTPLKAQVEARLAAAGMEAGGAIRLLTMPRILGHGFNPLSIYFCHRPDGGLAAILYEVSNTFGERHSYLIAAPKAGAVRQSAPKRFYVSPFMDMALSYDFRITPPSETCGVAITVSDEAGPMLTASFVGERSALTDAALLHAWLAHPLLTLKVVAGIHWEALKIFLKGVGFRRRPPLPPQDVTIGAPT
ncbi:MAG: DUF1365 domain-containing protein [Caulobacterales bacterium 68-7]|nr:MAG: DUF1365 domain-containing protein [Caulobacterales bacterium 68-7]